LFQQIRQHGFIHNHFLIINIMEEFKIGKKTYKVENGDFILDNGSCFQFMKKKRAVIGYKGLDKITSIVLTKKVLKDIDFSTMRKVEKDGLAYYYFHNA